MMSDDDVASLHESDDFCLSEFVEGADPRAEDSTRGHRTFPLDMCHVFVFDAELLRRSGRRDSWGLVDRHEVVAHRQDNRLQP